jgi:hypothetical protein
LAEYLLDNLLCFFRYGSVKYGRGAQLEAGVRLGFAMVTGGSNLSNTLTEIPRVLHIDSGYDLSFFIYQVEVFSVKELPGKLFWTFSNNIGLGLGFTKIEKGVLYFNQPSEDFRSWTGLNWLLTYAAAPVAAFLLLGYSVGFLEEFISLPSFLTPFGPTRQYIIGLPYFEDWFPQARKLFF